MELQTLEEALQYLRELDTIIMPPQFTYFNHCTSFQAEVLQQNYLFKKSWTEIPINGFVIKREMSFTERNQRIDEALGYGGREYAGLKYAMPKGAKAFLIRVVIPKQHLSKKEKEMLNIDENYSRLLQQEYMGLGDMRHPKLRSKEHILIFASSTIDEISRNRIDILYGVREQDVIRYATSVKKALSEQVTYEECVIPTPTLVAGQTYYEWDHNYPFNHQPYSIPRDKTFGRYIRRGIAGPNGEVVLYQLSDFEREYLQELRESYTNSEDVATASSINCKC